MFDIGFPELVVIAIVGLLVIGPKRLPEALRTLGLWIGRMRRSFNNVKNEIEKEIGMDEIRRQLHNEAVMEEMKRIERDVRDSVNAGSRPAGTEPTTRDRDAGTPPDYSPEPHPDAGTPPDYSPEPHPDAGTPEPPPEGESPDRTGSAGDTGSTHTSGPDDDRQRG